MVAEELPHFPRRDGEIGEGGILDCEDGCGDVGGEEKIWRDLEKGGGYVKAAVEAEGPGGVEGEGVGGGEWVIGGGVF